MKIAFKSTLSLHRSRKAKNEDNDCTVHAIANAWGIEYDKAHELARRYFKRDNGKGAFTDNILMSLSGLDRDCAFPPVVDGMKFKFKGTCMECRHWAELIGESMLLVNRKYPKGRDWEGNRAYGAYTIGKFIQDHPIGRFFVLVKGHACAIVDGVLYDMPGYNREGHQRRIEMAWEVE